MKLTPFKLFATAVSVGFVLATYPMMQEGLASGVHWKVAFAFGNDILMGLCLWVAWNGKRREVA